MPVPTNIYRMIHIDNLDMLLRRQALHAPNHCPADGLVYKTIHNIDVQSSRHVYSVPRGPKGSLHDYLPFYFGRRSVMLLNLHTGRVQGYVEGQEPLINLVSSVEKVIESHRPFVFTDGHGLAAFTDWYTSTSDLDKVDWDVVNADRWNDTPEHPDRQRRKQAEFLVHEHCPWSAIRGICVINDTMKTRVETILADHDVALQRKVLRKPSWYY